MSSLWINKKKKSELIALCDQLNLDTDGYLKSELEAILTQYLQENEEELSADPTFAPYYDTVAARPPTKRNSTITAEDTPQTRSRRRISRYVPGTESFDDLATSDIAYTPDPGTERKMRSGSRALAVRTPRTVRSLRQATTIPLPPSPSHVADVIEVGTNALFASAKAVVDKTEIKETATGVRDRLSNVISVNATSLVLEAVLLLVAIIPVTYELNLPAVAAIGRPPTSYILPDLFVLLTTAFWAPFMAWFLTAVAIPVGNALLFNLVSTTVAVDGVEYRADPLTFAVTRALVAYLVHYKGFTFFGLLSKTAIATVGTSVGRELQLIGAGIGAIAAIWVGILSR